MPEIRKILGQVAPTATVLTTVYPVPASTQAIISTLLVCNRGATEAVFRISFAPGGEADDPKHYGYYNILIPAAETFAATIGITLNETDEVRCYASTSNLSVQVFGIEIS